MANDSTDEPSDNLKKCIRNKILNFSSVAGTGCEMLLKLKKTLLSQNQLGMLILHMYTTVHIQLN